jgi:hypothetical protein
MPPLRSRPICGRCGKPHWSYVACDQADDRNALEERNEQKRRGFIIRRPREGFREFGDQLGEFERGGRLNGALILRRRHRGGGEQSGSFRE